MSKTSSVRSSSTTTSKSRYLRPVPYATTLALEQFFDGGSMEEHIARRTTSSAKPSPLSPHHHHHQSRRQSRHPSSTTTATTRDTRKQQQQQQQQPSTRRSEHHEPSKKDKRRTQELLTPVLPTPTPERAIGKGASLPVVDEKGQVWYDWEEKQEFAPLIADEHERSGWVNFPGATGRRGSTTSSTSDGEGSDDGGEGLPSPIRLPLHAVLDAFTFQPAAATTTTTTTTNDPGGGGGGAGAGAAAVDRTAKDPLHGLQVPPGARPRGKERRVVRRADSLPALDQAEKDAAAREFLDASFDPVKAMLAIQQQQQATVGAGDASTAAHPKLVFGKRASMSMKGLKKIFSRKKSTSA